NAVNVNVNVCGKRTCNIHVAVCMYWKCLIFLFYVAFYTFLAGMFSLTMYVMLLTLDDNVPTYQDRLTTPGMMIRPEGEDLEILYTKENTESWDMHVQALNRFLSCKTLCECVPDRYFLQDTAGMKNKPKRSCQFKRSTLGDCSGLADRYYGYNEGKPCVIIKMNRVRQHYLLFNLNFYIYRVDCSWMEISSGQDGRDGLEYFPPNGTFNLMYYPYYGKKAQANYSQPLVAVKFLNITLNTDINVECKLMANNILAGSDRDKFAGRVSFKLRVDSIN
uniref:Sodium/potassium-transporting ATPase subunit beta n=1 Tax=Electrophorus electricus TaxID=8005 RepID=A0A4W4FMD3_ELEEL